MNIEDDNISGAAILTERALNYLYSLIDREYSSKDDFLSFLEKECLRLSESQKSMISLRNELSYVLKGAEKGETLEEAKQKLKESVEERLCFIKETEATITQLGVSLITEGSQVLTHSRSSTVEKVLFRAYQEKSFDLIVCESRPNYEGRLLAEAFGKAGVPVTLVVDSAASFFNPDIVLVGADSITPDHVINKVGTRFLASCFPVYVACSANKFTTEDVVIEEKDPKEVLEEPYKNVSVRNYYFDRTPLTCMTGFITEYGILTPQEVKSLFM